jgi:hypothetical protein
MRLFKKVLFTLFPKILFVQIICHALLLFIAVKAIPVNTELHSFYNKGHIFIILLVAILGTLIFAPKVFKIVFMEPNKGQRITRIALLFFILSCPEIAIHKKTSLCKKTQITKNVANAITRSALN